MKTSSALLGVLGGIGIGVALGVLFAPDKGIETRKKIGKKGADLSDDIKLKFDDILDILGNLVTKTESKGNDLMRDGQALIEQINDEIKINK